MFSGLDGFLDVVIKTTIKIKRDVFVNEYDAYFLGENSFVHALNKKWFFLGREETLLTDPHRTRITTY